ncbi:DNA helicase II [Kangiella koreensis]|uniref:DNA 3'-5' helicase n=1 Tax=Kangiella koreensis (strain DSM 16069 / JCM 12317 / KCTC 12182 / SW-125) TaxID=523791 RepID=C7R6T7_KANKD|nr:DNA helicase II [Kangiella koreensis]ACV25603.1 UvrD/REP helicase [Kangiella koreensis DSM 16069]
MDATSIIQPLNDAQKEAVTAPNKALLVLAGAGSGKTRVLVHRIAWLVQVEHISAHSILAVTFTNKAAKEMLGRVEDMLAMPARGMWIGTFHSIAHRLLRAHYRDVGLPEGFQILDAQDQLRVIKRVMKELNLDDNEWPPKQAQWFINAKKDDGLRPGDIHHHGDFFVSTMVKVYYAYEEACKRGGLVDFNELLLRAYELWANNPHLLKHYQDRFQHILVDEFQDTNAIQYAWIRLLCNDNNRITIVGDDDQSIYGWRGARIENIQQFEKDFPDCKVSRLEQNYRSTSTILKAANAVIANNHERMGKSLWTDGNQGEPIILYSAFNEQEEARFIAARIEDWIQQGNSYDDIAILYRSNAQSRILEDAMLQKGIPYRIYGGLRFFERAEIKDTLAYMRLMANRDDDTSFERVVNQPARGLGEKSVDLIRAQAREEQTSLWQAANKMVVEQLLPPRAKTAMAGFLHLINELESSTAELDLWEQTDIVIEHSGLLEMYSKEKGEKGQARKENLQELVNATREFDPDEVVPDELPDMSPLQAFIAHATLEAGETQADEYQESVQLMTLHSAKGLEFPLVFIAGVEEKLFPHQMSVDEPGGLEEERRLAYVGITRAMKQLYLTFAEKRRIFGRETYPQQSRFIREIPDELLTEVRLNTQVQRPVFNRSAKSPIKRKGPEGFYLGQLVKHPKFGTGIIINYEGEGPQASVQINFEKEGLKKLMLAYAKLEPVT